MGLSGFMWLMCAMKVKDHGHADEEKAYRYNAGDR